MAMLLLLSSGRGEFSRRGELAIDFAGDVALETPDDLRLGHALLGAPSHVVLGRLMGGETHDDDAPECAIGVPIAAMVEAMAAGGLSGGRRQWCHTAEIRERTLRAKSLRIVAGSHEHGSGDVGA